jgi:hypothetical protein
MQTKYKYFLNNDNFTCVKQTLRGVCYFNTIM